MRRKFYNLVLKSQSNEESRKVVEALYNTTSDEVGKVIERPRNKIKVAIVTKEETIVLQVTTQVRDPKRTVTKGRDPKRSKKGGRSTVQYK
jgi:hypothetical protein